MTAKLGDAARAIVDDEVVDVADVELRRQLELLVVAAIAVGIALLFIVVVERIIRMIAQRHPLVAQLAWAARPPLRLLLLVAGRTALQR